VLAQTTSTSNDAVSLAVGVGGAQVVIAGGGQTANLQINNSASYNIESNALANGAEDGTAIAVAIGNIQVGVAETAIVGLTNSGAYDVAALATANGGDDSAFAFADVVGAAQVALGNSASVTLTNTASGTFNIVSNAIANANTAAGSGDTAQAVAGGVGVVQGAIGDTASAGIDNSGTLSVNISASATSDSIGGFAGARAGGLLLPIDPALLQFVSANGGEVGDDATASITNSGSVLLNVSADASGSFAVASAFGVGILQDVTTNQNGTALVTNSGVILQDVGAKASGGFFATASAFGGMIGQTVSGEVGVGDVAAIVDNTGTIHFSVHATASDVFGADAEANGLGIQQIVSGGDNASTLITNTSTLSLDLSVVSHASGETAFSVAIAGDGEYGEFIDIPGEGEGGEGEQPTQAALGLGGAVHFQSASSLGAATVTNTVANSGAINIDATATATAFFNATATAIADGFSQLAFGGIDTANTITNSGTLSLIDINANATADGSDALAIGVVFGAFQSASDVGFGVASNTVTNEGTFQAFANADATADNQAIALAVVGYGIGQTVEGADSASNLITNSGTMTFGALAEAESTGSRATAVGVVFAGIGQVASATAVGGVADNTISNSGSLFIGASASATAESVAIAQAFVTLGVIQSATATSTSGVATSTVNNSSSGLLVIAAEANAVATDVAAATAVAFAGIQGGIVQLAEGFDAAVDLTNSGTIQITASGDADGTNAYAYGTIGSAAVFQSASATGVGSSASASFVNNTGALFIGNVSANATGDEESVALAGIGAGVVQVGFAETATADFTNGGTFLLSASAVSVAGEDGAAITDAFAGASIDIGVAQSVTGDGSLTSLAAANLTNSGTFTVDAEATASAIAGAAGNAFAVAGASGVFQGAFDAADASVTLTNSGEFSVLAEAFATGDSAIAFAGAQGVEQAVTATTLGTATASFVNSASGVFSVFASATAVGEAAAGGASATVNALGVEQGLSGTGATGVASFSNAGLFQVGAYAEQDAFVGTASAFAGGLSVSATGIAGDNVALAVVNSGTFSVHATAVGSDEAFAFAGGIGVFADGVTGGIANSGTLDVAASASAANTQSATATGILIASDVNTATVTNTGLIDVRAITNGGFSDAVGIRLDALGGGLLAPAIGDTAFIVNDGGTIRAMESVDGGLTFQRGTAIDVQNAPNAVEIDLKGTSADGFIYGDIEISADDSIVVSNGETRFLGTINSDLVKEGSLNIVTGGTFFMDNDPTAGQGPSFAYVDDLNIQGTIAFRLPLTNDTPAGTEPAYSQIVTNTANITGGTIEIRPDSVNGLYGDSYFYDNVIDATSLTGTFANEVLNANTPLLALDVIYDANDNVDIGITRIGFGDVAGLTINQTSTGNGIEAVYDPNYVAGPFHNLLATLFTLNFADYTDALDQLAGAEYADYLQALQHSGRQFEGIITDRLDCAEDYKAGTPSSCHVPGEFSMWARATYSDGDHDGDVEAPAYKSDQWLFAIGGDYAVNSNLVIGGAIGAGGLDIKYPETGARIDSDGYQAGLYASYDTGVWYLRGIGSYASYDGDSRRLIDIGSIEGIQRGSPGGNVWSFYGEGGYRWGMVTPFIGFGYTNAELDSWTEKGTGTADIGATSLKVRGGTADNAFSNVGVRWIGSFGDNLTPDVRLSWRHDFGDERATYDTGFAVAPGSEFSIISAEQDPDSAVLGIGLTGNVGGGMKVKFGYDGLFNSAVNVNSVSLKLTYTLGGGN
jgi:uncharacterized protein with beta-barrel porin domain